MLFVDLGLGELVSKGRTCNSMEKDKYSFKMVELGLREMSSKEKLKEN